MINVDTVINRAEQHCKEKGVRFTKKRKQVLWGLVKSKKALSAYELIDFCRSELDEKITAMSMYRILNFLQEELLVHRLNLANKYVACSHITCDHEHNIPQFLICGKCNDVKEISINEDTLSELKTNVKLAGFNLVSPQLEMDCICEQCLAKNSISQ